MNQQQGPSFIQTYRFVQWGTQFIALTVMVFLRKNLGFRIVSPIRLFLTTGLVASVAILAIPGNEAARAGDLFLFAIVAFLMGMAQRFRRWVEFGRGIHRYSYDIGDSILDFSWLPNFIRRNRKVARYGDALVCAGLGFALIPYSRALALYLIFAAFCLRHLEDQVFQRQRSRDLDLVDSVLIAEDQTRTLDELEQTATPQHQPSQGIPSGMGSDIHGNIQQNKQKRPSRRD